MSKRKLYPKVINYYAKKVGERVTIITDTGERLTAKTLQVNAHDNLYIENPDGSIYAKECSKCGKMYILNSSFHKARRDDGSERYHSHCANCRKEDIAKYKKVKKSKIQENTIKGISYEKCKRLNELAINAGYGDVTLEELIIRYAKGVELIEVLNIRNSSAFYNYILDGMIDHLEKGKSIPILEKLVDLLNPERIVYPYILKESSNVEKEDIEDIYEDDITVDLPKEMEVDEIYIQSGKESITIKGIKLKF